MKAMMVAFSAMLMVEAFSIHVLTCCRPSLFVPLMQVVVVAVLPRKFRFHFFPRNFLAFLLGNLYNY